MLGGLNSAPYDSTVLRVACVAVSMSKFMEVSIEELSRAAFSVRSKDHGDG